MTVYPPKIKLPYRVSRRWREERILTGDLQGPVHQFVVDLDRLRADPRARALAVWKHIRVHEHGDGVEVIGSGILSSDLVEEEGDDIPFEDPPAASDAVIERIGRMPELQKPASTAIEVIKAYERWLERYMDLAAGALATFIDKYAPPSDDDAVLKAARVKPDVWRWEIGWKLNDGRVRSCEIDGRTDLELLRRCRGAFQRVAAANVGDELMSTLVAGEIVGNYVELDHKPRTKEALVEAFEDHCERLAEVTLAYTWTKQREKLGFDVEMRRWAFELGSERLQMGIEDGYRMVPVYLTERIEREVPGFYAYARENRDGVSWQPRTGPTKAALTWRRAIQAAVDEHRPAALSRAKAEVVWMKCPPIEMCDRAGAWTTDYDGDAVRAEVPFEAVVVPNWLGRYTLVAGVISEEYSVPDYLLLRHVLNADDYELTGLPKPPAGADTLANVPIDTGEFERIPVVADEDIPF